MTGGGDGQGPVARGQPSSRRGPVQQNEHGQELEALQAERLQTQELQRRLNTEAREMKRAEQERQLLAQQLRSKWEQERARELQQLEERSRRQRAAELWQLLQEKEAERRREQELLQRQREDAAQILALKKMSLQRRLFYKEMVKKAECGAPASHDRDKAAARRHVGFQVSGQQEPCTPGSGDGRLLEQKAKLLNDLQELRRRYGLLQEQACLLKDEGSLLEAREKAGRLAKDVSELGLLTKKLKERVRQLKELASRFENPAAKTEEVDQQLFEKEAMEKLRLQKKLDLERSRLKNRSEELKVHLAQMLEEKAARDQENSQLLRQNKRIKETEAENAALKQEVLQVSEQRNAKQLIDVLHYLSCEFQNMSQLAKIMQQREMEREETELMLQKKEEEAKHWQKAWAERQRAHEEELQALRAQLTQSEQRCQQQRQRCELLSQGLELEKSKNSNRIISHLPQETTAPSAQARDLTDHEDGSDASEKSTIIYASSTTSDVTLDIPGCCFSSDEGSVDGSEESEAWRVSSTPQSLGPNECSQMKFPLALGNDVYVFGDKEQCFKLLRELQDFRRGILPSTAVAAEGSAHSQASAPELHDPVPDSGTEASSCSRRGQKSWRSNK
nr:RIMS-binding protein 3-like [Anas platyrhynchos]